MELVLWKIELQSPNGNVMNDMKQGSPLEVFLFLQTI